MTDFLIVEYNGDIGGRVAHTTFGVSDNSYTIELGANWVQPPSICDNNVFEVHAEDSWNRYKA